MTGISTATATTMTATSAAVMRDSSWQLQGEDDGGCAVDLGDVHRRTRRDDVLVVVGASAPHLAADANLSAAAVDDRDRDGPLADERVGPGPDADGHVAVPPGDRPDDGDQQHGDDGEGGDLGRCRSADGGD